MCGTIGLYNNLSLWCIICEASGSGDRWSDRVCAEQSGCITISVFGVLYVKECITTSAIGRVCAEQSGCITISVFGVLYVKEWSDRSYVRNNRAV